MVHFLWMGRFPDPRELLSTLCDDTFPITLKRRTLVLQFLNSPWISEHFSKPSVIRCNFASRKNGPPNGVKNRDGDDHLNTVTKRAPPIQASQQEAVDQTDEHAKSRSPQQRSDIFLHRMLPPSVFFFSKVMFIPKPFNSLHSTSNATGIPASSLFVPLTMLS